MIRRIYNWMIGNSISKDAQKEANETGMLLWNRNTPVLPPLKIMIIADLHMCFYEDMQVIKNAITSDLDAIFCLGDIYADDIREIAKTGAEHDVACYYILGNHDKWGQNANIENAYDIDGKVINIHGIKIAGVSGAPKYKDGNFAMRTEEEIEIVLKQISDVDVLLSHESSYHLLSENRTHRGYQAITEYVLENKPAIHIFGHHHQRAEKMLGNTKELCAYQCAVIQTDPFEIVWVL